MVVNEACHWNHLAQDLCSPPPREGDFLRPFPSSRSHHRQTVFMDLMYLGSLEGRKPLNTKFFSVPQEPTPTPLGLTSPCSECSV